LTSIFKPARTALGLVGLLVAAHAIGQAPSIADRYGKNLDEQISRDYPGIELLYKDLHVVVK